MKRLSVLVVATGLILILAVSMVVFELGKKRHELIAEKINLEQKGESLDFFTLASSKPDQDSEFFRACWDLQFFNETEKLPTYRFGESNPDWNTFAAKYASAKPLIQKIADLAHSDVSDFQVPYTSFHGFLDLLIAFQSCANIIATNSALLLRDGDTEEASNNILAILAVSSILQKQPYGMARWSAATSVSLAKDATWNFIQSGLGTRDQLTRLQSAWEKIDLLAAIPQILRTERASALRPRRTSLGQQINSLMYGSSDELFLIRNFQKLIEVQNTTRSTLPWQDAVGEIQANLKTRGSFSKSARAFVSLASQLKVTAYTQSLAEMSIAALALERFRLDRGEYPENLSSIDPTYVHRSSIDPFNGEPLHYRRLDANTFLLYCVGSNRKDDGGSDASLPNSDSEKMDIVWPPPRQRIATQ